MRIYKKERKKTNRQFQLTKMEQNVQCVSGLNAENPAILLEKIKTLCVRNEHRPRPEPYNTDIILFLLECGRRYSNEIQQIDALHTLSSLTTFSIEQVNLVVPAILQLLYAPKVHVSNLANSVLESIFSKEVNRVEFTRHLLPFINEHTPRIFLAKVSWIIVGLSKLEISGDYIHGIIDVLKIFLTQTNINILEDTVLILSRFTAQNNTNSCRVIISGVLLKLVPLLNQNQERIAERNQLFDAIRGQLIPPLSDMLAHQDYYVKVSVLEFFLNMLLVIKISELRPVCSKLAVCLGLQKINLLRTHKKLIIRELASQIIDRLSIEKKENRNTEK